MTLSNATFCLIVGIISFVVGFIFLNSFLLTAFGFGKKYIWMGVALLPALAFVLYFDLPRIWFYMLVGGAGWIIGYGIEKLLAHDFSHS